ncbi:MAG: 3'-5' exoribonuclease [Methyloprofundus sp.]|nr:3'-5' exoribonuclease [Methyloprofundus sp.]
MSEKISVEQKYTDVVIDIETLSTQPNALVATVGIAAFNVNEPGDRIYKKHHIKLSPNQQHIKGRHVCPGTQAWWGKQSIEAIDQTFIYGEISGINQLYSILEKFKDCRVWGNGPEFDLVILESLLKDFGFEWPFKYWNHHSVRTAIEGLKIIYSNDDIKNEIAFEGVKHCAVDDAMHEAYFVQWYLKELRKRSQSIKIKNDPVGAEHEHQKNIN